MIVLERLAAEIIRELISIQGVPVHLLTSEEEFQLPRMIGLEDDRALYVNERIDNLIQRFVLNVHETIDDLMYKSSINDLQPMMRSMIGASLAKIDLDEPIEVNAISLTRDVLSSIRERQIQRSGPQEHCFGCFLFGFDVDPFEMGPLRVETRRDWLERRQLQGEVDTTTARRIAKVWLGNQVKSRKTTLSSLTERDILDLVGKCRYVVSVRTDGLTQGFGRERALVAARIALTGIALLWATPSRKLAGFNLAFDRELRFQTSMTVDRGNLLTSRNKSNLTVDGSFRAPEWAVVRKSESAHFSIISEVVDFILRKSSSHGRDVSLQMILHSIMWFHEGCRETSPLLATLKYAASMDALAKGRKEAGILKLFDVLLGWPRDSVIFADGTTLKTAISKIYGQGRSRTIHGNNDQSGLDWSSTAARAEKLAKHLLLECIELMAAEENRDIDIDFSLDRRVTQRRS